MKSPYYWLSFRSNRSATQIVVSSLMIMLLITAADSQDAPAKLLDGATFTVPDEDRFAGIHGEIKVAIDVDKVGNVDRAVVYVGPGWPCGVDFDSRVNKLMRAIEKSVSEYKFSPATKNGKPVAARLSLTLKIPKANSSNTTSLDMKAKLVSGGVINGKATKLNKPAYPAVARSERASGAVSVQVLIDEVGTVIWSQAISGHPLLMFASRDAACSSQFSPTLLQGSPVKVSGIITYNFVP